MINSTMAFGSESASFLLISFLTNGNFLFFPFSHLVQTPTVGQDSVNCSTSPKKTHCKSSFPSLIP